MWYSMSSARPRAQSQHPNVGLQCRLFCTFRTWLDLRVESVMRGKSGHWLGVPITPCRAVLFVRTPRDDLEGVFSASDGRSDLSAVARRAKPEAIPINCILWR